VFLLIGVMWMTQAFASRGFNPLRWLALISGILTAVLAFWVSGQFFLERAYTLLVSAGIWALASTTSFRAFQIRELAGG
jgi:uncharacterized membrane protein HdeD (DUF308 family)